MPSITIEINTKGDTKVDAEGFRGRGCQRMVDRIATALGAQPEGLDHQWKPEAEEVSVEQVSGG